MFFQSGEMPATGINLDIGPYVDLFLFSVAIAVVFFFAGYYFAKHRARVSLYRFLLKPGNEKLLPMLQEWQKRR